MRILFGVFDWGLGHATRDILLIEKILEEGHKVDIISTGRALKLLKNHFRKKCNYFDVPSVYSPYTKTRFFSLSFVFSIPKIYLSLKKARDISKKIIEKGNYDKVISDCRYDVYDNVENSYLINHQLRFKSIPIAQILTELLLKKRMDNYKFIIVPDFEKDNLTGILSHNLNFLDKSRIKYIGILSHLNKKNLKKDVDFFVSLSGPEPQRSILEKKLFKYLVSLDGKIIFAGGNPDKKIKKNHKNIEFYNFLDSKLQEEIMNRAKFVITRSGYTTIMELVELGIKNVLLIPTPGQTEQEYLGDYYEEKKYFHHTSQYNLDLKEEIKKSFDFKGFKPLWKTETSIKKFMKIVFGS